MDNKNLQNYNLDLLSKLDELKQADPQKSTTKEAMRALSMVGNIMNTIMNGGQVDPVFVKKIVDDLIKRDIEEPKSKKIIKKKKLNPKKIG
jgi:hypothetical protein